VVLRAFAAMAGKIMDPSEGTNKKTAYDDEDDPYAYPSVVPKNYNPDKELSDIDQKPSEMEKGSAIEEAKTLHTSQQQVTQPAPAKPSEASKPTNPLQEAPQASKPAPVSSSASGDAAANLMSKVEAPKEPAKTMEDAPRNSEQSHNIKEEGKSTCKCLIQ
jgi:hypothetical protein